VNAYTSLLLCLLALIVGALIPAQAAANAALSRAVGGIAFSSLVLFGVALLTVSVFALVTHPPVPAVSSFAAAPAFSYVGGLIVASYVLAITYLAPRLGVGTAIAFVVTGQILSSALIDHFGLLNSNTYPLDARRMLGIVLLIAGAFLAKKT
jgi:transporter family-2 protein